MKASWHMSLVACLVVSSAITAASQNKVIWKASVMPERIAVYESNSTESSIVNTLERGDVVDVVFEVTVSGTDWCRVARAEASEPLGFVLCLNLGKGSLVAKQNLQAVPAGNHSLALAASPASDQASAGLAVLTNKDILELHKAGLKGREGESKTGATVALTVLFGPIGLIKHGKEVQIRAGTPLTVFVDQDILLPPIE